VDHQRIKLGKMLKQKKARSASKIIFTIVKVQNKKKWTNEEDAKLIFLAQRFHERHWKEISKQFSNKNSLQCFSRYKRIRPGIVKGSWTQEEDNQILGLVNVYGKNWSKIAKSMRSRNGKQIRDRFINILDPEIKKGKFTDEEDEKLIQLYMENGPRWAYISGFFPNRTADMIKNRFHSSIKKNFNSKIQNYRQEPDSYKNKGKRISVAKCLNKIEELSQSSSNKKLELSTEYNSHTYLSAPSTPSNSNENKFDTSSYIDNSYQNEDLIKKNDNNFLIIDEDLFNINTNQYNKNLINDFGYFNYNHHSTFEKENNFSNGFFNFDDFFSS